MVGLVDQDRHVLRDALDDRLDLLLRHDHPRGVVRVAEIEEADLAGVLVGQLDHLRDVLRVVGLEADLDRVGLDRRGVLVDRSVGRIATEDLLATQQEGGAGDVQNLARAGAEQDVLGLHAVMGGDRLHDVAVRIAIPVGVLPGVGHRLHHRVGDAEVVLIARELRHSVVLFGRHRPARTLCGHGRGAALSPQLRTGPRAEVPDRRCHPTHEIASRYVLGHSSSGNPSPRKIPTGEPAAARRLLVP